MDNYKQNGDRLSHTVAGTDISSGDPRPVGTGMIGVALDDGVVGDVVEMAIEGVFVMPKVSGAVIAQGEQVLWDNSNSAVDDDNATPAANDFLCGYAWEAAGNGDTTIAVKINRTAPTVT